MSRLLDRLELLKAQGTLIHRPSAYGGYETPRTLYVTRQIAADAKEPFSKDEQGEAVAEMAAWFDAFSDEVEFSVSENCKEKPPDTMLARVCPPEAEFWSIRVIDPEEKNRIRVFGAFAARNKFVALHWDHRGNLDDFTETVNNVRSDWSGL